MNVYAKHKPDIKRTSNEQTQDTCRIYTGHDELTTELKNKQKNGKERTNTEYLQDNYRRRNVRPAKTDDPRAYKRFFEISKSD